MRNSRIEHNTIVKGGPNQGRLVPPGKGILKRERLTTLTPSKRQLTEDGPQPLDLVIQEFLRMKEGVRAHKTLLNYRERLKLFYSYVQEEWPSVQNAEDVTPRVIKDYMDYMSARGNAKGTVFNRL